MKIIVEPIYEIGPQESWIYDAAHEEWIPSQVQVGEKNSYFPESITDFADPQFLQYVADSNNISLSELKSNPAQMFFLIMRQVNLFDNSIIQYFPGFEPFNFTPVGVANVAAEIMPGYSTEIYQAIADEYAYRQKLQQEEIARNASETRSFNAFVAIIAVVVGVDAYSALATESVGVEAATAEAGATESFEAAASTVEVGGATEAAATESFEAAASTVEVGGTAVEAGVPLEVAAPATASTSLTSSAASAAEKYLANTAVGIAAKKILQPPLATKTAALTTPGEESKSPVGPSLLIAGIVLISMLAR